MAQPDISPDSKNTHIRPSINEGFRPATNNDAILVALLQHEEDNFLKLTVENRSQQIRSEQMADQLSQRYTACLGAAATWRGWGAESGVEGKYDHEGWNLAIIIQQQEVDES